MSLSTFVSTAEAQEGNGGSTYQNWYGSKGASLIKLAPSTEEPPKEKGANGKNI